LPLSPARAERPDPGGRRLRQNPRADHPHRLADPNRPGVASGILAVTFTNKAAKEMLTRLSAMLPINTRGMWIGTFHGLCNRLLRTHHRDAALPQTFQILDTQDQLSAIKRLLKAQNVDDEKFPPKEVMYFINGAKDQGLRATRSIRTTPTSARRSSCTSSTTTSASAKAWSILPSCCCAPMNCCRNQPLREHYQQRFRTSWSTSSRIPTTCNTSG
jgi:DNA helicase-2/ATP-dependent DNA helicase PcrA